MAITNEPNVKYFQKSRINSGGLNTYIHEETELRITMINTANSATTSNKSSSRVKFSPSKNPDIRSPNRRKNATNSERAVLRTARVIFIG